MVKEEEEKADETDRGGSTRIVAESGSESAVIRPNPPDPLFPFLSSRP